MLIIDNEFTIENISTLNNCIIEVHGKGLKGEVLRHISGDSYLGVYIPNGQIKVHVTIERVRREKDESDDIQRVH